MSTFASTDWPIVEEEIKAAMIGMLDATEKEVIPGKALVQETLKVASEQRSRAAASPMAPFADRQRFAPFAMRRLLLGEGDTLPRDP
jgi:hypothetical protein